ncbi:unnamed protein product [Rhizoctonia solani]|uniref:Zn(2)-C6 fungal-type domain-containing protein n=1 Tax=Rhizoctonia solani TaxID=456999 RepID=A0A8H3AY82_9AGAM|nr:unnamed protein product [Rhizoctonia solani]
MHRTRGRGNCATCVFRGSKCDGGRSGRCHCTKTGPECGGYPSTRSFTCGVSNPQEPLSTPVSRVELGGLDFSGQVATDGDAECCYASKISDSQSPTPFKWPSPPISPTPLSFGTAPIGHLDVDSPSTIHSQQLIQPTPIPRQAPASSYQPIDTGHFDEDTNTPLPPNMDVREYMTPGQASLFDALLSLARPRDEMFGGTSVRHSIPLGSFLQTANLKQRVPDPKRSYDVEDIGVKLCGMLALDRNVESNSLPFMLQSYALWMQLFLFEPIRVVFLARENIIRRYSMGPGYRWRMFIISNTILAIAGSTGYTLKDLGELETDIHRGLTMSTASFEDDQAADCTRALLAMRTIYEFTSISFKVVPLFKVVKTMQLAAPIFRRACPDPNDRLVNLPNLLTQYNVDRKYYAILDVILSAVINRPMNFRYDTTMMPAIDLENSTGMQWVYGVPDRLTIILARMNGLLEDFGPNVDHKIINELEADIKGVEAGFLPSADPSLAVGRLFVQECWRQVAYIYLYMGLCGADSHDARVVNAHGRFMEIFMRTKPGRNPDSFLILPLPIESLPAIQMIKSY